LPNFRIIAKGCWKLDFIISTLCSESARSNNFLIGILLDILGTSNSYHEKWLSPLKIMTTARDTIVDALDIESFVLCESEKEAKELVGKLMQSLGLSRFVIVSLDFNGPGAHFRVRAYLNKPGDNYTWLKE